MASAMNVQGVILTITALISGVFTKICTDKEYKFELTIRWAQTMATKPDLDGRFFRVAEKEGELRIASYPTGSTDMSLMMGAAVGPNLTITGDGHVRNVISINGQFPGPPLEVTEGAKVSVRVSNELDTSITLHWHGIYQRGTPWMDGVGMLTQCPIQALQSFTYRFTATPSGTHWYHGHTHALKQDGLYGFFIVHKQAAALPPPPEHLLAVQDWDQYADSRTSSIVQGGTEEMARHRAHLSHMGEHTFQGTLVNGRGRTGNSSLPLQVYNVTSGERFRFRVVNAAASRTYRLSVDSHDLSVVASDGYDVRPVRVQSTYIHPGETVDVEIVVDQTPDRYWIRLEGQMLHPMGMMNMEGMEGMGGMEGMEGMDDGLIDVYDGMDGGMGMGDEMAGMGEMERSDLVKRKRRKRHDSAMSGMEDAVLHPGMNSNTSGNISHMDNFEHGLAILSYWQNSTGDPASLATNCTVANKCRVFNCLAKEPRYECVAIDKAKSREDVQDALNDEFGTREDELVAEHFLNFGFSMGHYQGSSVNSRKFLHPKAPMYQRNNHMGNGSHITPCSSEACRYGCHCTNILKLPTEMTVQLVFANLVPPREVSAVVSAHHPIHLHGHGFTVLKVQEPLQPNENSPDIRCVDDLCSHLQWNSKPELNFDSPPIKDTLLVPVRGYAVVRFRSDNPGYWFLHCHQQQHMQDGMALIVQEGEQSEHPALPPHFPECPAHYDMADAENSEEGDAGPEVANDELHLSRSDAAAAVIGFILCGAAVAAILIFLLHRFCCSQKKTNYGMSSPSYGQENIAFR